MSVSNPIPVVKAVNIYTGQIRLVMDAAYTGVYSHNGRYFAYINAYPRDPTIELMLYDTETRQTLKLNDNGYLKAPPYFAEDDSYIIARIDGSFDGRGKR